VTAASLVEAWSGNAAGLRQGPRPDWHEHNLRAIPIFAGIPVAAMTCAASAVRISIASGFGWVSALSLRALTASRLD